MNYEEMSDFEINARVGVHLGKPIASSYENVDNGACFELVGGLMTGVEFNPCNNPSDAWPIIETIWSDLSSVVMFDDGIGFGERNMTMWNAQSAMMSCGKLRAAMIVFLKMREGTQ